MRCKCLFNIVANISKRPQADLIVLPFFKEKKGAKPKPIVLPLDLKEVVVPVLESKDFSAKEGMTTLIYLKEKQEKRLLILGLGEETECNLETLRRSYAAAIKRCQNKKWSHVNLILPVLKKFSIDLITRAVSEGVGLCLYLFEERKSEKEPYYIKKINLIGGEDTKIPQKTSSILSGVNLARDLVNRNAIDVTPQALVKQAKELASRFASVKTSVLNKKQIEKEKMGLLLAVASGSCVDPALIMIEYRGKPRSSDRTMIVGKGVTFDTGGLNLKPSKFIEDMRTDMGGAATAIGVIQAAASIHLEHNIVSIIPATENAIGPCSYKPGDVYLSYQGTTVEITNTDAEGRLILADALTYGQRKFSPSRIIDLATLTGAIVVSLGEERSGLFSNQDQFAKLCEQAGETTGEKVWRMPLDPEYKVLLKSSFADIANASTQPQAGSVTAAIFLQEFITSDVPWIHLDIAGTAFLTKPKYYHLTPATGVGVRLIIELLEHLPPS